MNETLCIMQRPWSSVAATHTYNKHGCCLMHLYNVLEDTRDAAINQITSPDVYRFCQTKEEKETALVQFMGWMCEYGFIRLQYSGLNTEPESDKLLTFNPASIVFIRRELGKINMECFIDPDNRNVVCGDLLLLQLIKKCLYPFYQFWLKTSAVMGTRRATKWVNNCIYWGLWVICCCNEVTLNKLALTLA